MTKEIFVLRLSEDGLHPLFLTTAKAIHNEIMRVGYQPESIEFSGFAKTYSYKNLCEAIEIRKPKAFPYVCDILCEGKCSIEVNILSKND